MINKLKATLKLMTLSITGTLLLTTTSAYATPAVLGGGCGLLSADTSNAPLLFPNSILPSPVLSNVILANNINSVRSGGAGTWFGKGFKYCIFPSLPTLAEMDTTCDETNLEVDGQTNYIALLHTDAAPQPTFCIYKYDIDIAAADERTNGAVVVALSPPSSPTAVPVFTPLGLLAMMSGLLWFGKRRRKFK